MTTLSKSEPPVVVRDSEEERRDLLLDVEALLVDDEAYPRLGASCTRPSILRRFASFAAPGVPAGTDRLISSANDTALVTALSLHTGIPFATLDDSGHAVLGELHTGENVVLIAYHRSAHLIALSDWVRAHGGDIASQFSIFGSSSTGDAPAGRTLITYAPLQFSEGDGL